MIVKDKRGALSLPLASGRTVRLALVGIVSIIGVLAVAWLAPLATRPMLRWAKDMAYPRSHGSINIGHAVEALRKAPVHWIQGLTKGEELPRLRLDVKFQHWQRIMAKREEAMRLGVLMAADTDEVPAIITDGVNAHRAKIRLKGDLLDHLQGKTWSLRVKSKGPFFGMRRFSLHHPRTRAFALTPLFQAHARLEGILAPRSRFVTVTVNGDDWGIMQLEEHAGKELLEFQGRKEGVLGRLDDRAHWEHIAANHAGRTFDPLFYGPYNNYWTANFRAYREGKLRKDPRMAPYVELADALVARYQDGTLPPGEVFELEAFARYLVVATLWGDMHTQYFDNFRLYLNPFTLKLVPIAGDGRGLWPLKGVKLHTRMLAAGFMRDESFREILAKTIPKVTGRVLDGDVLRKLESDRKRIEATLHRHYPFLLTWDLSIVRRNAALLTKYGIAFFPRSDGLHTERPPLDEKFIHHVQARVFDRPEKQIVISNMLHQPVAIEGVVAWCANPKPIGASAARPAQVADANGTGTPLSKPPARVARVELASNLSLAATPLGRRGTNMQISLPPEVAGADCAVEVKTRRPGTAEVRTVKVTRRTKHLDRHPLSSGGLEDLTARSLPWLTWNRKAGRFDVSPGNWTVYRPLVLPEGSGLRLGAGTTLSFAPDAYVLVRGPFDIEGSADRPVVLEPRDRGKPWKGIYVLSSPRPSQWRHARISGTTALQDGYLNLTGAVTFYRSDVIMADVSFLGTEAEDALNIVHARFSLNRIDVRDTRSDGFDCDFCDGTIYLSTFSGIGGDAVDVSGTRADFGSLTVSDVRDKAVSVGEGSTVTLRDLTVRNVGTAVASKDRSEASVIGATIDTARVAGLMSYVKKKAYGPAVIKATGVTFGRNVSHPAVAQTGSSVMLNGKRIAETDLDVDKFYKDGPMKK